MNTVNDICKSRHGGNENSVKANEKLGLNKAKMRIAVFIQIGVAKDGLSCKELAKLWGVGMNVISGRFTELKKEGRIEKIGSRENSAVYQLTKIHENK